MSKYLLLGATSIIIMQPNSFVNIHELISPPLNGLFGPIFMDFIQSLARRYSFNLDEYVGNM